MPKLTFEEYNYRRAKRLRMRGTEVDYLRRIHWWLRVAVIGLFIWASVEAIILTLDHI